MLSVLRRSKASVTPPTALYITTLQSQPQILQQLIDTLDQSVCCRDLYALSSKRFFRRKRESKPYKTYYPEEFDEYVASKSYRFLNEESRYNNSIEYEQTHDTYTPSSIVPSSKIKHAQGQQLAAFKDNDFRVNSRTFDMMEPGPTTQGEINRDLDELNRRIQKGVLLARGPVAPKQLWDLIRMREMKEKWPEHLSFNVTNDMIDRALDDIEDQVSMFLPYNHVMVWESLVKAGLLQKEHVQLLDILVESIEQQDLVPQFQANSIRRFIVAAGAVYKETGYRPVHLLQRLSNLMVKRSQRTNINGLYSCLWDFQPRDVSVSLYTLYNVLGIRSRGLLQAVKHDFLRNHTFVYRENNVQHSFTWYNRWRYDGAALTEIVASMATIGDRDVKFLGALSAEFLRKKHAPVPGMNWAGFDLMGFKVGDFTYTMQALDQLDYYNGVLATQVQREMSSRRRVNMECRAHHIPILLNAFAKQRVYSTTFISRALTRINKRQWVSIMSTHDISTLLLGLARSVLLSSRVASLCDQPMVPKLLSDIQYHVLEYDLLRYMSLQDTVNIVQALAILPGNATNKLFCAVIAEALSRGVVGSGRDRMVAVSEQAGPEMEGLGGIADKLDDENINEAVWDEVSREIGEQVPEEEGGEGEGAERRGRSRKAWKLLAKQNAGYGGASAQVPESFGDEMELGEGHDDNVFEIMHGEGGEQEQGQEGGGLTPSQMCDMVHGCGLYGYAPVALLKSVGKAVQDEDVVREMSGSDVVKLVYGLGLLNQQVGLGQGEAWPAGKVKLMGEHAGKQGAGEGLADSKADPFLEALDNEMATQSQERLASSSKGAGARGGGADDTLVVEIDKWNDMVSALQGITGDEILQRVLLDKVKECVQERCVPWQVGDACLGAQYLGWDDDNNLHDDLVKHVGTALQTEAQLVRDKYPAPASMCYWPDTLEWLEKAVESAGCETAWCEWQDATKPKVTLNNQIIKFDTLQQRVEMEPGHSRKFVEWYNNFKSTGMLEAEEEKAREQAEKERQQKEEEAKQSATQAEG